MVSIPPTTLRCRNASYTYRSRLTATVHLYTNPTGHSVIIKCAPKKEAETHTQINDLENSSIIRLLDVTEVSPFTTDAWLVLEYANNGTLRDLLAHARGAEGSTPRKIPASLCFHILAGILNAIVAMQETHGVQHIDLHAGNILFHMPSGLWPPAVKVIDFGKTIQIPEEESEDDISWDEASSPSFGPLARSLLAQTDVLEDEFLLAIRGLANQMSPLQALRTAREDSSTRAKAMSDDMPEWLLSYFGQEIAEGSHEEAIEEDDHGYEEEEEEADDDDDDDDDDDVNGLIIQFRNNIRWQ